MYAFNNRNLNCYFSKLLVTASLCICGSSGLFAKKSRHLVQVLDLKNNVLAKIPGYTEWKYLKKGHKLPFGTLIQVGEKSSITIRFPKEIVEKYMGVKRNDFILQSPMIVRLEFDLIRKIKINSDFLDQKSLEDLVNSGKIGEGESLFLRFKDAMQRSALFSYFGDQERHYSEKVNKQDVAKEFSFLSQAIVGEIKLFYPRDNSLFSSAKLPISINVYWGKAEGVPSYNLYFWKLGSRRQLYKSYKRNYTTLTVALPGTYHIQITSKDNSYQSKIIRVKAFDYEYIVKMGYFSWGKDHEKQPFKEKFQMFPEEDVIFVNRNANKEIKFCWENNNFYPDQTFKLRIFKDGTFDEPVPIITKETKSRCHAVSLSKGRYAWDVTTKIIDLSPIENHTDNPTKVVVPKQAKTKYIDFKSIRSKFSIFDESEVFTYLTDELQTKKSPKFSKIIFND